MDDPAAWCVCHATALRKNGSMSCSEWRFLGTQCTSLCLLDVLLDAMGRGMAENFAIVRYMNIACIRNAAFAALLWRLCFN